MRAVVLDADGILSLRDRPRPLAGDECVIRSDVSTGRAPNAVDGEVATYWQPLMSDRTDNLNVWLRVDLGAPTAIDKAVLNFRTPTSRIDEFVVQASPDGATWQEVYRSTGAVASIATALFEVVTARFIRADFTLNAGGTPNFQLNEFELYDTGHVPPPPVLSNISFSDASGHVYAPGETVSLRVGDRLGLFVEGQLSNGEEADLQRAAVALESSKPAVASIDSSGTVALAAGVTRITASVTLDGVTKETHLWIDVYDASTLIADLRLTHPTMALEIGRPAVLAPGDDYPVLHVLAHVGVTLAGELMPPGGGAGLSLPEVELASGVEGEIRLPGTAESKGLYQLRLRPTASGGPAYDAFFFTVRDPGDVPAGQSAFVTPQ